MYSSAIFISHWFRGEKMLKKGWAFLF